MKSLLDAHLVVTCRAYFRLVEQYGIDGQPVGRNAKNDELFFFVKNGDYPKIYSSTLRFDVKMAYQIDAAGLAFKITITGSFEKLITMWNCTSKIDRKCKKLKNFEK